jgi:two-component system, OmpR family, KDP operon response regulator KdpE
MPLSHKTIVAIDDTPSILNFLRISLESLGVQFHGAMTASGGLALCESRMPDLIILDLGLPDKEGFDILPRLRALNQKQAIPVIVLTVRNSKESRDRAAHLGASAYMTKPFEMSRLLDLICEKLAIECPVYLYASGTHADDKFPYGVPPRGLPSV